MRLSFLDIVLPHFCVGCGKPGILFCKQCASTIEHILPNEYICPQCKLPAIDGFTHPGCINKYSIDGLVSFFHYKDIIKKSIKEIKYRFIESLVIELVRKSKPYHALHIRQFSLDAVLVPIPLHKSRLKHRGFNQAETLASVLAKTYNMNYKNDALVRLKNTQSQTGLFDKKQRLLNVKDVFSIQTKLSQHTVVLVDDVFTTGATMREATKILKTAGVKQVFGVTIAR